jgi:hypothetical protein
VTKIIPIAQLPHEYNNLAGLGSQPINCTPIPATGAAKSSVYSDRGTVVDYIRK